MQDAIQMFPVRIRYKYLPEVISRNQFNDLFHTRSVQFIENIIQQ